MSWRSAAGAARRRLSLPGRRWALGGLAAAVIALALLGPLPASAAQPQERRITVSARDFEFTPAVFEVNRGDTVIITLESADVVHGLFVDGYQVSTQAEPGRPGELRFVADHDGAFHFRCAVPCGNLHPFMIGKLIVGPNLVWLRAVLASLAAAAGALIVFWKA